MIYFDELTNVSSIQQGYLIACCVFFVLYRIFISITMYTDAKERQTSYQLVWSAATLLFGVFIPIIYIVVNHKNKRKQFLKCKIIFLIVSLIFLALSGCGKIFFDLSQTGEFGYILDPVTEYDETSVVVYDNDKGKKVRLDKMGNEYTYYQRNDLLYFDRNNVGYKCTDDTWSTLLNTESNQVYSENDYDFYIDDGGYLCIFEDQYELDVYENEYAHICYDEEHLYFSLDCVCWDKEGNIVFPEFINGMNVLVRTFQQSKVN